MVDRSKLAALIVVAIVTGFGTSIGLMSVMLPNNIGGNTTVTTTEPPTTTTTPPLDDEDELIPDIFTFEGIELMWIIIGGFKLKFNQTVVYVDPYNIYDIDNAVLETADYIIVTHDHSPHSSMTDINALSDNETVLISARVPATFIHSDYTVYRSLLVVHT